MRAGRTTETIGALAGAALVVLVFLPWWEYDPAQLGEFASGWTSYAPLSVDGSLWSVWPGRAFVVVLTGALAVGLLFAAQAGAAGRAVRWLRRIVVAAATGALAIAIAGLADPPIDDHRAAGAAYVGTALIAAIATCTATGLRRA